MITGTGWQVFDMFDLKRNGVIEFGEFVRSLSIFHPKAPESDKTKCTIPLLLHYSPQLSLGSQSTGILNLFLSSSAVAFKLYDLRGTGYIEREEVKLTSLPFNHE